jgi:hypothetical protein
MLDLLRVKPTHSGPCVRNQTAWCAKRNSSVRLVNISGLDNLSRKFVMAQPLIPCSKI